MGDEGTSALEEHMRALLADEASADVRLVVQGEAGSELVLSAHKCVLACRSAYFRALFSSEFRERSQSRLPLEDITPEQLLLLLNFIYTDDWMVEDADFALDMIPIADRFSVLDLKRLCERTLICCMSVENVARIFSLADRYACSRLRGRALLFMTDTNHFHMVMKTDSFAELDKMLILEILHSHKTTPGPPPLPAEPLPGNSATAAKAGQSKLRDHRHGRGSGGSGAAGTARPASVAANPLNAGDHGRSTVGGSSASSSTAAAPPHALGALATVPSAPDGPLPSSGMPSMVTPSSAHPSVSEPLDGVATSSSQSSMADEPPPPDLPHVSGDARGES